MKEFILFITILFILLSKSFAVTLEDVDSISSLLINNIDHPKQKWCGLTPSQSTLYLSVLHAMNDELSKKWGPKTIQKKISNCAKDCHCELYLQILDKYPEEKIQKLKKALEAEQQKVNTKKTKACLEAAQKKFCQSVFLLKELPKKAQDFSPAPADF